MSPDDADDVANRLRLRDAPPDALEPSPVAKRTYKLTLAYDGAKYFGWQYQPDRPTVQGALEAALKQITQESIRVAGSGRTDAGVHALGQVVSFQTVSRLGADVLQKALNATLPHDIAVVELLEAAPSFHAIRDCLRKRYRYLITAGPVRDVFSRRYAWHVFHHLDVAAIERAAQPLLGTHDFASFETQGSERESTVRTVYELIVTSGAGQGGDALALPLTHLFTPSPAAAGSTTHNLIAIEIEADGFLYNMVRTIVGTLVKVGAGKRAETWPAEVLAARNRRLAGMTAPAHGLFLVRAEY